MGFAICGFGHIKYHHMRVKLRRGALVSRVDAVVEHELTEAECEKLRSFEIEGAW